MSQTGVLEQDLVSAFIFGRLTAYTGWSSLGLGDPPRIHEGVAPPDSADAGTFIVYHLQTPDVPDVSAANPSQRIMADALWLVKAVVRGQSYLPGRKLAQQIDLQLDNQQFAAVTNSEFTGTIIACVRVGSVRYPETDRTGEQWRHTGLLYRVQAQ